MVVHRLPHDESIVWPASRCPGCGHALSAWENIPLFSFAFLQARCRSCRAPISWRYPLVEALGGAALGLAVWRCGLGPAALGASAFALFLIAVAWIDAEHRVIPDELSAGVLAWTVVPGLVADRGSRGGGGSGGGCDGARGTGVDLPAGARHRRPRGRRHKLAAGLGAFLGLPGVVLTLCGGDGGLCGRIALISLRRGDGRTAFPSAPFWPGPRRPPWCWDRRGGGPT